MTISFDLDDTLIPGSKLFETERQNFLQRILGVEKIRLGTVDLMKELKSRGHTIFIYTTSFRNPSKIKFTFRTYGIRIDNIINQTRHDKELKENRSSYSKYPPAFGIDLHIDDSHGVRIEGERFNFRTIIIEANDKDWGRTVLNEL